MFFGAGSSSPKWWSVFFSEKNRVWTTKQPRNNFRFFRRSNIFGDEKKSLKASVKTPGHLKRPTITRPGPPKGVAFLEGKSPLSESAGAPPGNATPPYYWKDYSPPSNLLITPLQKALFLRGGGIFGGDTLELPWTDRVSRLEHQISAT